jgi:RNA polymerase sigma factor (sigma-70 family)
MSSISPAAARIPAEGRSALRLSRLGDELLARQAARGSERAFTALYERYYQPLYRYCRSIVRDDSDAQDALQSTFTGAFAALTRDARNAPLRPWLYRIAHNESVSLLRRRKRDAPHEAGSEATAVGASAAEEAAGRARWRRVVEDLAELPERQRGALLLRELAGLSHEEIALTFGTTVGAAKQAIFEARQGLAELEEGRAMSCTEVRRRISEGDRRLLRGRRVNAHLRDCAACEAFAVAIPARESDLRALAPALPPAAAAALLGRVIRAASPHGGASVGSAASAAAVGKTAGTVIGWKALATVGVLATTAAGVTGLTHVLQHSQPARHRAVPATAVTTPRPTGDHAGSPRTASAHRSGSGQRSASAERTTTNASHHSSPPAIGHAKHHRSHHGAARKSSASSAGGVAHTGANNSQAGSHSHSAPGQITNRGVRRHGSASTTHATTVHAQQTSRSSQTTRLRTTRSSIIRLHSHRSTRALRHSTGLPTTIVNSVSHSSATSSTPATVPSHPTTGTASK